MKSVILIAVISITGIGDLRHRKPSAIPAILILRGGIWREMSVTRWNSLSLS
jgi:hypothetical protein